jgi:hypothetical protein
MSDPIGGGPRGPLGAGLEEVEGAVGAEGVGGVGGDFSAALAQEAARAQEVEGDASVEGVIAEVAGRLGRGELRGPEEALGAVIEGIVEVRFAGVPPEQRAQMSQELREVLLEDPFFVLEVEASLSEALGRG